MIQTFVDILKEFQEFLGSGGLLWGISAAALLLCAIQSRESRQRLFWPSILVLFFFFNPLVYKTIGIHFMRGVYWRMLWLLPMPMVLAYAGTILYGRITRRWMKLAGLVVFAGIIGFSGELVYSSQNFEKAYNQYQIPQYAIDVADAILADDTYSDKKTLVPNEFICYFREYTSKIPLMYGRNAVGYITDLRPEEALAYEKMSEPAPTREDYGLISYLSIKKGCNYVVINGVQHPDSKMVEVDGYLEYYKTVDGYDIYRRVVGLQVDL